MRKDNIDQYLNDVTLYPNPSSDGIFNLKSRYELDVIDVILFDVNGKLIKQRSIKSNNREIKVVNFKKIASGVYLLSISVKGKQKVIKVLIE